MTPSPTPPIRSLAVVGSAGRNEDAPLVTPERYSAMAAALRALIAEIGTVERLVSGGAAFADHLAVGLFLRGEVPKLQLHLPAIFSLSAECFVEPERKSRGAICNHWHRSFSARCGGNSLAALCRAIESPGAEQKVHFGFSTRNAAVAADADALVAFSFGKGAEVKSSWGTAETVRMALERNIQTWHIDLHTMERFCPARLPQGSVQRR